jgi:Tfp pilus assembly protein PilO
MADIRSTMSEFWRKLARRERVFVVITLFCVLSALLFQFPYSMLEKSKLALQASISATEQEIVEQTLQLADLKRQTALGVSSGWQLADQKSAVLFLEDVSGEARRIGVGLVSVHPTQEIDKVKYMELSMNLDLKGRYRELGEYFKRLEGLSKIVNVRKIRIESCPDGASVCAAQVEAVTYMAK